MANDGALDSNVATVTITVNPVNDAPVADDDAYSTDEDTSLIVAAPGVLGNDTDTDGDALTAVLVTGPANGSLTLNANGSFTYTPDADFNGTDSFTYVANDGDLDSNVATVTLTIDPVNDAPTCDDPQSDSTDEDTTLNGAVLCDDIDANTLTYSLVADVSNGSLTFNPDGTFSYSPDADFNGADSFTFHANDEGLDSNTATFNITVNAVNDAPECVSDSGTTDEDTQLSGSVVCSDVDGDALTVLLDDGVANGSLSFFASGSFTYTPDPNFNGTDDFTFHAYDGLLNSGLASYNITVIAVNDIPDAVDDVDDADEDGPAITIDVLANDSDADLSDVLSVDSLNTTGTLGSVTNNGTDVTYDPNGAFESLAVGETATDTFSYTITDGQGGFDTATVTVTIHGQNDIPDAVDDVDDADEDGPAITIDVLANDSDADLSDVLSVDSLNTGGTLGSVTNNGTDVTYDPNGAFESLAVGETATDTFSYTITDGQGGFDTATVTVTIHGQNDIPDAVDDVDDADEDGPAITIDVLANDSDADLSDVLSVDSLNTGATLGSVTNNGTDVTYDPNGAFESLAVGETATDTFSYTITDGQGGFDTATVTVTIHGQNDIPDAVDDVDDADEDGPAITIDVLANDSDADLSDVLSVDSLNTPARSAASPTTAPT